MFPRGFPENPVPVLVPVPVPAVRPGTNTLQRSSLQSSLTIPFERTFRNLDHNRPAQGHRLDEFTFCGCGWPQHMLLPRGTAAGMPFQLFVMVSDHAQDKVTSDHSPCTFPDQENC